MSAARPEPASGLEVHEVDDGLVVYDPATDRVHYLNPSASIVLSLCDGTRDESDLAELVRAAWGLPDAPLDDVRECIGQLLREQVLR